MRSSLFCSKLEHWASTSCHVRTASTQALSLADTALLQSNAGLPTPQLLPTRFAKLIALLLQYFNTWKKGLNITQFTQNTQHIWNCCEIPWLNSSATSAHKMLKHLGEMIPFKKIFSYSFNKIWHAQLTAPKWYEECVTNLLCAWHNHGNRANFNTVMDF